MSLRNITSNTPNLAPFRATSALARGFASNLRQIFHQLVHLQNQNRPAPCIGLNLESLSKVLRDMIGRASPLARLEFALNCLIFIRTHQAHWQ